MSKYQISDKDCIHLSLRTPWGVIFLSSSSSQSGAHNAIWPLIDESLASHPFKRPSSNSIPLQIEGRLREFPLMSPNSMDKVWCYLSHCEPKMRSRREKYKPNILSQGVCAFACHMPSSLSTTSSSWNVDHRGRSLLRLKSCRVKVWLLRG